MNLKYKLRQFLLLLSLVGGLCFALPGTTTLAASTPVGGGGGTTTTADPGTNTTPTVHYCGGGTNRVKTTIDLGCTGQGNPVADMAFGIIRFLSAGVGLVVVGSIIVGGIQYTTSADEPQAKANAIKRIRSSLIALLVFIFAYAILNYVIPAGFFK